MKKQSIWLLVILIVVIVPLILLLVNIQRPDENVDAQATAIAGAALTPSVLPATEILTPATATSEIIPSVTAQAEAVETQSPSQVSSRVYVAVESAEGSLSLSPVTFTEPISGLEALLQTGLEVITSETSFGTAVCSIEGVGCPADNCFCSSTNFWNYLNWDWEQTQWVASAVGASATSLSNHAFDGWRWQVFEDTATPPPAPQLVASAAMSYLLGKQDPATGGYGSLGSTMDFLLAAGASGTPVSDLIAPAGVQSLQDYILLEGAAYAENDAGSAGKLAMGLAAAQVCAPSGAKPPQDYYDPTTGAYSDRSLFQAFAMLGVLSSGESVPADAVAYLNSQSLPSGGWAWFPGEAEDSNTTAIAIQALIASGEPATSPVILNALTYLQSFQNEDGGFSYSQEYLGVSDTNSTAYVVQAILAAGQSPVAEVWTKAGNNPVYYLLERQLEDGSFEWQAGSGPNDLATMQAVVALHSHPYPINTDGFSECAP